MDSAPCLAWAGGGGRVCACCPTALDSNTPKQTRPRVAARPATFKLPAAPMDVRHAHDTDIYAVRACPHEDGADLVAIGGAHSVEVLLVVSCGFSLHSPVLNSLTQADPYVFQTDRELPRRHPHNYARMVV